MTTIIATRGSKLAMWQANHVKHLLSEYGLETSLLEIKTTGDRIQDRFLHEIGGKGVFIRELEEAMLQDKAQLAIHSLKDLPAVIPEPFKLAAILKRHSHHDLIIFSKSAAKRLAIPNRLVKKEDVMLWGKLKIATGSLRRQSLLKGASNTVEVVPLRGNVDTRLRKLEDEGYDAIILAEASLDRLSLKNDFVCRAIDPDWFVPSPSQGALAIEMKENASVFSTVARLGCQETTQMVGLERGVLKALGADCTLPVGVHFIRRMRQDGKSVIEGRAVVLTSNGKEARAEICIPDDYPVSDEKIIAEIMAKLKAAGGEKIMSELGLAQPIWPSESVFLRSKIH